MAEELSDLAQRVERVMKSELDNEEREYDRVEAIIFNQRNVGVQGDGRSYVFPAEIAIYSDGKLVYDPKLLAKISTRITNEIEDVNRVVVLIKVKKKSLLNYISKLLGH